MFLLRNFLLLVAAAACYSCTDPVDIKLKEGEIQLALDGSITDQRLSGAAIVPDTIRLTRTSGFSDGRSPVVENALVVIKDNAGNVDTLSYLNNGKYLTHPGNITGLVGRVYELIVALDGETYHAIDELKRVTTIDSLVQEYRTEPLYGRAPGYFINLYSKDLQGPGDFYRFKVYKNGDLFNRPFDLNISADAGFGVSNPIDNLRFIFPIRENLNPSTNEPDPETSGDKAPYIPGDEVRVEILSISKPTYYFYGELASQISNDGLFARPASNVPTNLVNMNPASSKQAVGWFSASAIASKTIKITER